MNFTILRFETIGSTNDEALRQARAGAPEGLSVVATRQTAGRGRHGRLWASPPGGGLYFSVILRPKIDSKYLSVVTLMAGVAVYDTLAELGLKPDIKWVNDVLIGEKKICGILAEAAETPSGLAVAAGIGINLTSAGFPVELADTATSITAETAWPGTVSDLERLLVRFIDYFYNIMTEADGPARIVEEWRRRSSYFSGKSVRVRLKNAFFDGITDGLESAGALRVITPSGELKIVTAGDVQHLRSFD